MATVLVTGGAGFIGSHVCQTLLARGDRVICLDNFDDFYDPILKKRNLQEFEKTELLHLVEADIRDTALLRSLIQDHSIDAIVHLAARAGIRESIQSPLRCSDVNLTGTVSLLEAANSSGVNRFIFASSSSVYGEQESVPFHESATADRPISPYAASKRAGELLCYSYSKLSSIDITCLRFFTVYGPRQRPEMAIHRFTKCIHNGETLPLFGDGSAQRDFTYVSDIVTGVVASLDRCQGFSIYNLGNQKCTTISKLIQELSMALGKPAKIKHLPQQPGDVSQTCANIQLAQQELDYNPKVKISEGCRLFVNWFLENAGEFE